PLSRDRRRAGLLRREARLRRDRPQGRRRADPGDGRVRARAQQGRDLDAQGAMTAGDSSQDPSRDPSNDPLQRTREIAVSVAREAGRILLEGWGEGTNRRPAIDFKSEDINLVTEYDKRSEALIVERLAAAFPEDRVVAEEGTTHGQERAGQRVWYVDPLDGTTNFAHGMPIFSVSLGMAIDRRPVLGVVEAPALGWSFSGTTTGGGATFNDKPIAPSLIERLGGALVVTGFPYARNPVQNNIAEFAALTAAAQ